MRNRLQAALQSNKDFAEKMQKQFQEMELISSDKYNTLNEKYEEIQNLFEERPSREEDLEAIKKLKGDLEGCAAELLKAYENAHKYKLLLRNREEAYNR